MTSSRSIVIRNQFGLTLIELMVSLVLGLLLMAGVLQLFAANKQSYQLSEEVARMQEGARYAVSVLERDIRMAGYLGCTGRQRDLIVINNKVGSPPTTFTPEAGIEGWETSSVNTTYGNFAPIADAPVSDASSGSNWATGGATAPVLDASTRSVANSDIVRLWHVDGSGSLATISGSSITATTEPSYAADDFMMLTDCQTVDIARVCSMSGDVAAMNGCSNTSPTDFLNSDGAHAFKLAGSVYFVGKRANSAANPPALYRRVLSASATNGANAPTMGSGQEIVEGVESLQLLYGEDTDATPDGVADRYVTANNVSDWNDVVGVRIHLLMQSLRDDIVDGSQAVNFNGAAFTATDGRLRYPFVATVSIRNRSL